MGTPKDSEKTRAKIIEAAGQLFAERGFKGVTVRDIVKKADTHLSALNYHFRTKDALYREVVLEACRQASISPEDQEQLSALDPEKALYLLINVSLKSYRDHNASNWQNVLLTKECWEPSPVFGEIIEVYFKPATDFISRIVGKTVDKPADDHQVRFSVIALLGLMDTFGLYGHLVDAVAPGLSDHLRKRNLLAKQLFQTVIELARVPADVEISQ